MNISIDPKYPLQARITNWPETAADSPEYTDLGGHFGIHGPYVFAAAPELLHALVNLLETCEYGDSNADEYNAAVKAISKAKPLIS